MKLFPLRLIEDPKHHFIAKSKLAMFLSIGLIIASFVVLNVKGLNKGIDFTGGIIIEARFSEVVDLSKLRNKLMAENLGDISLQNFGTERDIIIRVGKDQKSDKEQLQKISVIKNILKQNYITEIDYRRIDFVGPTIGKELIKSGITALLVSFIAIMFYIWIRFSYQFGFGAIVALLHDAVLTFGFFSITGLEFNITSIAAILTVIGYSINDSVVIYDRIRENLRKYRSKKIADILDRSINETLSRTVLTAGTTILALLALVLFGGAVIKSFSLAVLFGVIIGTYSSIFIAAPILNKDSIKKTLK